MPRPEGSKNKPKSASDLLEKVKAAYAKQGKELEVNIKDIADLPEDVKASIAKEIESNPDLNIPNIFELEGEEDEEDEEDTFTCGNCHAELDGEYPECPHCGMPLSW